MPAFQDRMIHVHSVPTLLMALLVVPSIARAQSITVCPDGSCDFTQLQSAIDSIPAGGSGEILVSAGTYDQGGITFGGIEVTIIGVDGAEDTILTQSGSEQVMLIDSGSVVALKGLTIRDGIASTTNPQGGGIRVDLGATLEMRACIIRENQSIGDGGGVWVADGATSLFNDCQFIDNEITGTEGDGGGLYVGWIDVSTIDRCGFHRNRATRDGGGLFQARGSQSTSLTTEFCQMRNCVFWDNFAQRLGGAAIVQPALAECALPRVIGYVTNCTFFKNYALYGGGIQGYSPEWCGSPDSAEGLSILVFNSILLRNEPVSIEPNQPVYRACSIDHLTPQEAAQIDCNNLNPQLLGDSQSLGDSPPDTFDARIAPESFMIDRGIESYFGVPLDPGTLDYNSADRVYDDPNTTNAGSSLLDIGATEYDVTILDDLDQALGIPLSIWTNDTGSGLYTDPGNWFARQPPSAERGWIINESAITVRLPDRTSPEGAAVLGSLASFRGSLTLESPAGGSSLLQVPQNDNLSFASGIYLGLVYSTILNLDDGVTVECDLIATNRARIYMNGGVLSVGDSVTLDSSTSSNPGPAGLRISTLHGPGLITRTVESVSADFDPVLVNNGRIRVDDLIRIEGDYEQGSGTLKFQSRVGDILPSLDRRVEIEGRAKLGGTIVFDIAAGAWQPPIGSCFPVLTADEGFEPGADAFDFVVTRWASDDQNRFFVLSNDVCDEGLADGGGGAETVNAIVVSLDALQSQNETLQAVGVSLEDLLMLDVDGDGFEDMVLSIDTGGTAGQVVVLLNQGLDGTTQWQGFEPFSAVTGITVGEAPRGLDAGYFLAGSFNAGNRDIVVANQGGSITLIGNTSVPGSTDLAVVQTIDLVNGEPSSDGFNPQPVTLCAMNFDEDACGLSDLVVACLDNSIWTFQNLLSCEESSRFLGPDPLGNSNETEDATAEPISRFVPGLGSGGGKRNDKTSATGASKDSGKAESGRLTSGFTGTGFTLAFTPLPVLSGAEIVDIAEGDLDGNGYLDLVVANRSDDSFGIILATGKETYDSAIIIELDQGFDQTESITLADVDGDFDLDIALVCRNQTSGLRVGRVIRNTLTEEGGLGWVFDNQELLDGQEPYLIRSSDVDGDGIDDLLALTADTNAALSGSGGSGGFGFGTVGAGPVSTCIGDLTEDDQVGGPDLAILLGTWGACSGRCLADFDASGVVDGVDLATLLGNWGACTAGIN